MEFNSWEEIALFLGGGLAMLLLANLKSIVIYFSDKYNKASKGIKSVSEISETLWNLSQTIEQIDRVAILRAGNGGSKPMVGKNMKASMIYNSWVDPRFNKKADYQELLLDHPYISMLVDVVKEGFVALTVDEMPDHCMLKDIYKSEGITYSEIHYLAETNKYLYYISIATSSEKKKFYGYKTNNAITLTIQKIRNIFSKNQVD